MQDGIIGEPYKFVPPIDSRFWPPLIRRFLLPAHLRNAYGVASIETRGAERLKASIDAGHGVILAPNHCRMSDPLTFGDLTRATGRNMHAMASWHLFKQNWLNTFMLRRIGAFSVYREGVDRQAINTAVDILVEGRRPLVLFAEGAISRHNDVLMPLMDGVAFIARTAAKRREKIPGAAGVVIHPVAIRYFYRGDLMAAVTPVLDEIEGHFSWFPQQDKPLIQRLRQIAQALLSLKEIEYFGTARIGDFYERVDNLIQDVLTRLEERWNVRPTSEGVVARVKNLRGAIVATLLDPNASEPQRVECRRHLAACYYVQQMSHYPRNYVRQSQKNVPEHILETVERFEEDFTDRIRVHGPLHAVVQVGEAIAVSSQRDRAAPVDPVMEQIRVQLSDMLAKLSEESPRI
ncbi:MAG TPA: 1-acyl-sn-glycerol-3-phosphate acyltransferase [Lacipirellulaceae bacterium]|nr:1-acyl-sn-glycerol-3-phosphate acyltransferase [Lacipirellulaceae bacterium]